MRNKPCGNPRQARLDFGELWFQTMQIFESAINFMKQKICYGSRNSIIAHHDSGKTKSDFIDWWQLLYVNDTLCYLEQLLNDHCAYFASITTSLLKGQHTLVICTRKGEYNRWKRCVTYNVTVNIWAVVRFNVTANQC